MKKKFEIDNSFSNYKRRFCSDFPFDKSFVFKMKVASIRASFINLM